LTGAAGDKDGSERKGREGKFRTNVGVGAQGQTNAAGYPAMDTRSKGTSVPAKPWADLWFFSKPIFLDVK